MRIANTADATRAEATADESTARGVSVSSAGDDEEGENAANPITATRAMMRRLAYAIGIRGLTYLRGSRGYFRPASTPSVLPKGADAVFNANCHRRVDGQGICTCRVEQPRSWQYVPVEDSVVRGGRLESLQ